MSPMLHLADERATRELGKAMATALAGTGRPPALLLLGDLGSGKTTLVRGLVEALPGSELAEVSSPSFNICNLYPTTPPVAHYDLYRLENMPPDEGLLERLEDRDTLTVVEWAQFLDRELWPEEALVLTWSPTRTGRTLDMHAMGKTAGSVLASLAGTIDQFSQPSTGLQ